MNQQKVRIKLEMFPKFGIFDGKIREDIVGIL